MLERRYRAVGGEVNMVVETGGELVFVEVETSEGSNHTARRVDRAKRRRLTRVARHYLQRHAALETICRFDLLAVSIKGKTVVVEHLQNAFQPLD